MTVRWITDHLGTSPWRRDLATGSFGIVDVRLFRDAAGNSPALIREKIAEAQKYLQRSQPVVICCDYGISRSNAIAAAVLAEHERVSLDESLQRIIQATGETDIKVDFVEDIRKAIGGLRYSTSSANLVLGINGFIGRSISNLIDSPSATIPSHLEQAVLENPVLLNAAMEKAAVNRVLFCWHPTGLDTNRASGQLIVALRNVLEVCRVRQAGLIFLSGQQIFAGHGKCPQGPFSETDAPCPAGAAGDGLFLAETLIKQYEVRHGLTALIIRSSHVYGPRDERPGVLNTLVRKALSQEEIVTHQYKNGAPFIDLIHAHDLIRALLRAIENQLTGVLHIASGTPIATNELAQLIVRKASSRSKVATIEMPGDHYMVQLTSQIAGPLLGWRPTIDLDTGLSELITHTQQGTF